MASQVYQFCYTNTGRDLSRQNMAGWRPVAVTPGLTEQELRFCTTMQATNASIRTDSLMGFEIACDGKYLYYNRTLFGLTDSVGRPNIFAHCYIFPLAAYKTTPQDSFLYSPNLFLRLKQENFKSSTEEAEKWLEVYGGKYDKLKLDNPLNLETAKKQAGLTEDAYRTLLQCVYAQMMIGKDSVPRPLYVRCDDSEEQWRAFVYCIWSGLPWFLRRSFSAASFGGQNAQQNAKRNVVFTTKPAPSGAWEFDLKSGNRSNILSPQRVNRLRHYQYLNYGTGLAGRTQDGEEEIAAYYAELDSMAARFGDASNEAILKVLCQGWKHRNGEGLEEKDVQDCLNTLETLKLTSEAKRELRNYLNLPLTVAECPKKEEEERKKREEEERLAVEEAKLRAKEENRKAEENKARQEILVEEARERQKELVEEARERQEELVNEARKRQEKLVNEARKRQEEQAKEARKRQEQQAIEAQKRQEQETRGGLAPQGLTASERGKNPSARYHIWFPDGTETAEEKGKTDVAAITAADRQDIENIKKAIQTYLKKKDLTIERLQTAWESVPRKELWGYRSLKRAFMSAAWEIYINAIRRRDYLTNEKAAFEEYKNLAETVWVDPEDAISDAKLAFWDLDGLPYSGTNESVFNPPVSDDSFRRMSFEFFFYEKADFYREIAVEHGNCRLFLDFLSMTLQCKAKRGQGEDAWLGDICTFFTNHPATPADSVQKAKMLLVNELKQTDPVHHSLQWYTSWITFAAHPSLPAPKNNAMLWKYISGLYEAAEKRNGEYLYKYYNGFYREAANNNLTKLSSSLVSSLQSVCEEYDRGGSYAPLDFWLVLGKAMDLKPQCFCVFDPMDTVLSKRPGVNAKVLQMRPVDVISDTWMLLNDDQTRTEAQNYGLTGSRKKIVRNWLDLANIERKNRRR